MFTGLIETTGKIAEVITRSGSKRIAVSSNLPREEIREGESIAVDGVCLTVAGLVRDRFQAVVVDETLRRSTLGGLRTGAVVNLERALRFGDRLGGHLVQGHVDGVGKVRRVDTRGDDHRLWVDLPAELSRFVALKGSVALQGVSLTVSGRDARGFEVALIPETLKRTTLGRVSTGGPLNVEVDLLARYLEGLIQARE